MYKRTPKHMYNWEDICYIQWSVANTLQENNLLTLNLPGSKYLGPNTPSNFSLCSLFNQKYLHFLFTNNLGFWHMFGLYNKTKNNKMRKLVSLIHFWNFIAELYFLNFPKNISSLKCIFQVLIKWMCSFPKNLFNLYSKSNWKKLLVQNTPKHTS